MKIKDYKCKCGHEDFFFGNKGNQKGIYCSYCGKWLKWANKEEQNLAMKQEPVIDKIRAEISALKSNHINDCYDDGFQGCRTNVLQIIDKYKGESEDKVNL